MKSDSIAAELMQRGQLVEAGDRLRTLLAERETSVDWNDLGAVQFAMQELHQAEMSFRRALALDGSNARASANLGALLVHAGREMEAMPALEYALPFLDEPERIAVGELLQNCQKAMTSVPSRQDAVAERVPARRREWDEPQWQGIVTSLRKQADITTALTERLLILEREVWKLRQNPVSASPEGADSVRVSAGSAFESGGHQDGVKKAGTPTPAGSRWAAGSSPAAVTRRSQPAKFSPEVARLVDQFLECTITNEESREETWMYLTRRIGVYLQQLPDDFRVDAPYVQVAQRWMDVFVRNFVAGDSPTSNWRIDRARVALEPAARGLGLELRSQGGGEQGLDSTATTGDLPGKSDSLAAVGLEHQTQVLNEFAFSMKDELEEIARRPGIPGWSGHDFFRNGLYGGADGESLYCMIRTLKPRQIIHFGSANSVLIAADAIARNKALDPRCECHLIAADPFPNAILTSGMPGLAQCISMRMRDFERSVELLEGGSILFVDPDIAIRTAEDAEALFSRILPNLQAGAWVHLHDVMWRDGKPRLILPFLPEGNDLVRAFLAENDAYEVALALAWLHETADPFAIEAFPSMSLAGDVPPTAFWMRKVR